MRRTPAMRRAGAVATAGLLALLAASAEAAGITAETRWSDPGRVDLGVEFPGEGYHANWALFRCDCGDLLVRSELSVPGEVDKGETVLVQGRAVLSRGFGERQAELGSSLDAPALMMQLALVLLERAQPAGPAAAAEPAKVDLSDPINPIHLETATAIGGFPAPWSVRGSIVPAGENQRRFDLRFEFTAPPGSASEKGRIRLKGLTDFSGAAFPIADASSLTGWRLEWRDTSDPAQPAAASAETLEQLREAIRQNPL
ncbi:MAG: hypothetical protein R3233_04525 [Xanthomonadales bacterium]|nr:hypothetical protein [Xanthomonadales bacterium]